MRAEAHPDPSILLVVAALLLVVLVTTYLAHIANRKAGRVPAPGQREPLAEPPDPQPSAAVQQILNEADQFAQAHQFREVLTAGERALEAARKARDVLGEARAHE